MEGGGQVCGPGRNDKSHDPLAPKAQIARATPKQRAGLGRSMLGTLARVLGSSLRESPRAGGFYARSAASTSTVRGRPPGEGGRL